MAQVEVSLGLWQDRPPEEVIATAALADSLRFRRVWIGEMATWDAFALGAHVGASFRHSDLVLGPFAVAVRDPAMIAMGAASVAALTGRDVSVALGTSSTTVVEGWHGRSRQRSVTALNESARAVRALLDGKKAGSRGYRLRLRPPASALVVAAFGDGAIRAAVRYADRVVLNLVDPPLVRTLVERVRAVAAELDRPCPEVAVWVPCAVDPGPAAVEQLRRGVVGYLGAPGYRDMFARAGFADLVAFAATGPHPAELLARVPPELNEVVGLVGGTASVHARLREYTDAGADTVVVVPSATDDDPAGEHTLRAVAGLRAG